MAMIAASTHPFANWRTQRRVDKERYIVLARDMQALAQRMVICGMHVHAGIEDDQLRIDLMNQATYFLPHCSRCRPPRRSGRASHRAQGYRPRCSATCRAAACPNISPAPRSGSTCSSSWRRPACATTRARSGGTCGRARASRRSRCGSATSAPGSRTRSRSPRSIGDPAHALSAALANQTWRRYRRDADRREQLAGAALRHRRRAGRFRRAAPQAVRRADRGDDRPGEAEAERLGCLDEVRHVREIIARGTSADRQLRSMRGPRRGRERAAGAAAVVDWLIGETGVGAHCLSPSPGGMHHDRINGLDERTRTELEAAAFRSLVEHLREHPEVQNIDLMNLAGFCRNCLSKWYRAAAEEQGVALSDDAGARDRLRHAVRGVEGEAPEGSERRAEGALRRAPARSGLSGRAPRPGESAEKLLDQGRHGLARGSAPMLQKQGVHRARREIELDRMGAADAAAPPRQSRQRDRPGPRCRSPGTERSARARHRSPRARAASRRTRRRAGAGVPPAAASARLAGLEILTAGTQRSAGRAARPQQLAVHVDQVSRAGAFVQIVDVLGDHQHLVRPTLLEPGEGVVRRVGSDVGCKQLAAALVVEALHRPRLACEGLGGRNVFEPPAFPQATGAAKARQARFDRDAGAGQHHDRAGLRHADRLVHLLRSRRTRSRPPRSSAPPPSTPWCTDARADRTPRRPAPARPPGQRA